MVPISRVLIINCPYSSQVMCTQSAAKAGFILTKPPESCTPQINVHRLLSARPFMISIVQKFFTLVILDFIFIRSIGIKRFHILPFIAYFLFLLWHTFYFSGVYICKWFSTSNLMLSLSHLGFVVL